MVGVSLPTQARAHPANAAALSEFGRLLELSTEASGCGRLPADASSGQLQEKTLKTQQTEWAVGSKLAADAEQHTEMVTNEFIVQYVNRIEQTIVDGSGLAGCFVVKIIIDPEPNAYSLPGGFIYLTTGLIDVTESEAQLAAALAHETAHVTARHLTRFRTQARIWNRLALFSGPAGYFLRPYLGPLLMFGVIRRQELEADRIGLRYQTAAGYESLEFCRLLQSAISENDEGESFLERLTDTHPATKVRVRRLQSLIRTLISPRSGYIVNTNEFELMKTRFAALPIPQRFALPHDG